MDEMGDRVVMETAEDEVGGDRKALGDVDVPLGSVKTKHLLFFSTEENAPYVAHAQTKK